MKIAINGFGRIGRTLTRVLVNHPSIEIVAIRDIAPKDTLLHLLKYDSVHRKFPAAIVKKNEHYISIGKHAVRWVDASAETEPDWSALGVDTVVECTGKWLTEATASQHLQWGAKRVLLSAPPKDDSIPMVVLGVNQESIDWKNTRMVSNASCTTNSAAPLIDIMHRMATVHSAFITTVHSYTSDQALQDAPHKDLRRARAGAYSIVPTTTGAAKALSSIFPNIPLGGCGIRVPVPNGSLTDISFVIEEEISVQEINHAFMQAAREEQWKGVLEYQIDPIVSADSIGNTHSCIFDSLLTCKVGNMVKVVAWYDNEYGYSARLVDVLELWAKNIE